MTKDEAIAWAVKNLAEALEYEYFGIQSHAKHAAQAMTLLSNKQWQVVVKDKRYWLICES